MSNELGKINIDGLPELSANVEKLIRELQSLQAQFKATEAAAKKNDEGLKVQTKSVSSFQTGLTKLAGALGLAMGGYELLSRSISKGIELGKQALKAGMENEAFETKLFFSVGQNNLALKEQLKLKEQLNRNPLFSEDDIENALLFTNEIGRTKDQSEKMIKTAMGLSRVTGMDLQSALMQLNGTLEGQKGRLSKLSNEFRHLSEEQLISGKGIDILYEKYEKFGAVCGKLEKSSGELRKSWDELLESIGSSNGIFSTVIQGLADLVNGVDPYIAKVMRDGAEIAQLPGTLHAQNIAFKENSKNFINALRTDKEFQKEYYKFSKSEEYKHAKNIQETTQLQIDFYLNYINEKAKLDQQAEDAYNASKGRREAALKKENETLDKNVQQIQRSLSSEVVYAEKVIDLNEQVINFKEKLSSDDYNDLRDNTKKKYELNRDSINDQIVALTKANETYKKLNGKDNQDYLNQINDLKIKAIDNQINYNKTIYEINKNETNQEYENRKELYRKEDLLLDESIKSVNDYYKNLEQLAKNAEIDGEFSGIQALIFGKQKIEQLLQGDKQATEAHNNEINRINEEYDARIRLATSQKEIDELELERSKTLEKENSNYKSYVDNILNLINDIKKKSKDAWKDILAIATQFAQKISDSIFQNAMNGIDESLQKTLDSIDKATSKSQSNLEKLNQRRFISDFEYQKRKQKLDEEKEKKETEAKKEAAKRTKEMAIEQAIINAFLSATASLIMGGTTGIAMAAITLAMGLADAAIIASKPLEYGKGGKVPSYANGGILKGPLHSEGGIPLLAEGGERFFSREKTRQFEPLFNAIQTNQVSSNSPIVASVDHAALSASVSTAVINAIDKIDVRVSAQEITKTQKRASIIEQRSGF